MCLTKCLGSNSGVKARPKDTKCNFAALGLGPGAGIMRPSQKRVRPAFDSLVRLTTMAMKNISHKLEVLGDCQEH